MNQSLFSVIFLLIIVLGSGACNKKPEPAITQPPPDLQGKVVPAAAPPPAPPAPAPAAPAFSGNWSGNSGPDLPISFTVEGNQISSLSASYSGRNGTCSYNGSLSSEGPSPINDKTFTARGKNEKHGQLEFTVTGSFISPTEATGTVVWKGKSDLCGDIALQNPFSAKKEAATPEQI